MKPASHYDLCSRFLSLSSPSLSLQLLLAVAVTGMTIQAASGSHLLPAATSVVALADAHDRQAFALASRMKDEPMDVESIDTNKEEVRVGTWWLRCTM